MPRARLVGGVPLIIDPALFRRLAGNECKDTDPWTVYNIHTMELVETHGMFSDATRAAGILNAHQSATLRPQVYAVHFHPMHGDGWPVAKPNEEEDLPEDTTLRPKAVRRVQD